MTCWSSVPLGRQASASQRRIWAVCILGNHVQVEYREPGLVGVSLVMTSVAASPWPGPASNSVAIRSGCNPGHAAASAWLL
jgi:hypothetical protein